MQTAAQIVRASRPRFHQTSSSADSPGASPPGQFSSSASGAPGAPVPLRSPTASPASMPSPGGQPPGQQPPRQPRLQIPQRGVPRTAQEHAAAAAARAGAQRVARASGAPVPANLGPPPPVMRTIRPTRAGPLWSQNLDETPAVDLRQVAQQRGRQQSPAAGPAGGRHPSTPGPDENGDDDSSVTDSPPRQGSPGESISQTGRVQSRQTLAGRLGHFVRLSHFKWSVIV